MDRPARVHGSQLASLHATSPAFQLHLRWPRPEPMRDYLLTVHYDFVLAKQMTIRFQTSSPVQSGRSDD